LELFHQTEIVIESMTIQAAMQAKQRTSAIFFRFRWNKIRQPRLEAQSFYSDWKAVRTAFGQGPALPPRRAFSVAVGTFMEPGAHPERAG
jgi:hypothetical protein